MARSRASALVDVPVQQHRLGDLLATVCVGFSDDSGSEDHADLVAADLRMASD